MSLSRRSVVLGLATSPLLTTPALSARSKFRDSDPVDFGRRGPNSFPVHGIDAARFQGDMDWRAIRRQGIQFAWIKATEGGDLVDPQFKTNWRKAKRARVPIGAYHFYYFCTEPEVQANWFIKNVPRLRGGMPPVLDLEWNPYSPTCVWRPSPKQVLEFADRFMRIVERHYRTKVVIYTAPDFWERNDIARLNRDFWLRSTAKHIEKRYKQADWRFWQYTSTGILDGVPKEIDLNCFNGTQDQWDRWRNAQAVR